MTEAIAEVEEKIPDLPIKRGTGVNAVIEGWLEAADGYSANVASGNYSHAEGVNTTASGKYSHAEGISTAATGIYSHSEGFSTKATEGGAHAEGYGTTAAGLGSHAEGAHTLATRRS